jgi:hypothetical protein
MVLSLGKLSKNFYKQIPGNSFSYLFLKKFDTFIIEKTNYTLEGYPPIHINKNTYHQLISSKKYGLDYGINNYTEDLSEDMAIREIELDLKQNPKYETKIIFSYKNYNVIEKMNYNVTFKDKWYYHSKITKPDKNVQIQNTFSSTLAEKIYNEILYNMNKK